MWIKSIQLRIGQVNHTVLDKIVAEIVLFDTQQEMAATKDLYGETEHEPSEEEQAEQEEMQRYFEEEDMMNRHYRN